MTESPSLFPEEERYADFLITLKQCIRTSQVKAALAVNQELLLLYWDIGRAILERQQQEGWGSKVLTRVAKDLKREFPDMKGFSRTNLMYMRSFAAAYPDKHIVQRCVGQLPWRHNIALIEKLKDPEKRLWYAERALTNSWSRDVLVLQIESDLYRRQGGAVTNFADTLPKPQSDLARQVIKDPYCLDFLTIGEEAQERQLEEALVANIRDFLLELGMGFAFMGSQYQIEVDGDEYRLDLLFYHTQLRCYVVIDLKMGRFEPEYAGKMNFYVSAIDDKLRHKDDNPTIGIVLCKSKSRTKAEYALRNIKTPIAVSTHSLPDNLKQQLPSVEQLEMVLQSTVSEEEQGE